MGSQGNTERFVGTVKWFSAQKGFGFITRNDGEKDVFVHHTVIKANGYRSLNEGDSVEFNIENGTKGLQAVEVVKL